METLNLSIWALAPLIFLARVADVSLGTVRILVGFRGYRTVATLIGFCEALIWVLAVRQVLLHLDSQPWLAVAYASGFAAGNFLGITLERRLAVGRELVRVISYRNDDLLSDFLRDRGYRVVELAGTRRNAKPVQVIFVVERRKKMPALLALIRDYDPEAICTVTDVKSHVGEDVDMPSSSGFALRFKRK